LVGLEDGLVRLDRLLGGLVCGRCLFELLLGCNVLADQLLRSAQGGIGLREGCLVFGDGRLIASNCGLDFAVVQREQQIALFHDVTVGHVLFEYLAVDSRANNDRCRRFEDANGSAADRKLRDGDQLGDHRHRAATLPRL
jgi:hypothetical protein